MKRVIVEEICLLLWPGVHFVSGNFLCNTWIARHIWRHLHQLLSYMSLSWRGITVFTPSQCSKMLTLAVMWAVLTARSLSLWGFGELIKVVTQTCGCRGNRQHVTLCFWHMLRSHYCKVIIWPLSRWWEHNGKHTIRYRLFRSQSWSCTWHESASQNFKHNDIEHATMPFWCSKCIL